MASSGASLAAARDLNVMAEQILPPGVLREPLPKHSGQERGERGTPGGPPALLSFHFPDQDRLSLEIEIIDPRTQHFGAAGTRVGAKADH